MPAGHRLREAEILDQPPVEVGQTDRLGYRIGGVWSVRISTCDSPIIGRKSSLRLDRLPLSPRTPGEVSADRGPRDAIAISPGSTLGPHRGRFRASDRRGPSSSSSTTRSPSIPSTGRMVGVGGGGVVGVFVVAEATKARQLAKQRGSVDAGVQFWFRRELGQSSSTTSTVSVSMGADVRGEAQLMSANDAATEGSAPPTTPR